MLAVRVERPVRARPGRARLPARRGRHSRSAANTAPAHLPHSVGVRQGATRPRPHRLHELLSLRLSRRTLRRGQTQRQQQQQQQVIKRR